MPPQFSVLIPVYNHASYLHQAVVSSLRAEAVREVLLVDDGSLDSSREVISRLERSYRDRVRVLPASDFSNLGAPARLNQLAAAASCDWLAVLNSDDEFVAGRFDAVALEIQRSDADFYFGSIALIDKHAQTVSIKKALFSPEYALPEGIEIDSLNGESLLIALANQNYIVTTSNMIFSKQLYKSIGGFGEYRYCHDWDFALRASLIGKVHFIPQPLTKYRVHGNNTIGSDWDVWDLVHAEVKTMFGNLLNDFPELNDYVPFQTALIGNHHLRPRRGSVPTTSSSTATKLDTVPSGHSVETGDSTAQESDIISGQHPSPCAKLPAQTGTRAHDSWRYQTVPQILWQFVLDTDATLRRACQNMNLRVFKYKQLSDTERAAFDLVEKSEIFDRDYYSAENSGIKYGEHPLLHFIKVGSQTDRNPSGWFDISYYRRTNSDLEGTGLDLVMHYIRFGASEKRQPSEFVASQASAYATAQSSEPVLLSLDPIDSQNSEAAPDSCDAKNAETAPDSSDNSAKNAETAPDSSDNSAKNAETAPDSSDNSAKNAETAPDSSDNSAKNADTAPDSCDNSAKNAETASLVNEKPNGMRQVFVLGQDGRGLPEYWRHYFEQKGKANAIEYLVPRSSGVRSNRIVLFFGHEASRTGAPMVLLEIVRKFAEDGYECITILKGNGPIQSEFAKLSHVIDLSSCPDAESCVRLYAASLVDIPPPYTLTGTIINSVECQTIVAPLSELATPILYLVHELSDGYSLNYVQAVSKLATKLVFSSEFAHESFQSKVPVESAKVRLLSQGLLDPTFAMCSRKESRKRLCDELDLPESSIIIIGCGSIELRKGCDLFVEAAHKVLERTSSDAHFIWIGKGEYHPFSLYYYLNWDIDRHKIADNVHFIGERADLTDYFAGADLFLLLSRQDPLPCVVQLAMAASLPVIAFDRAGGAPEMLRHGGGDVVPYGDTSAVADLVVSYAGDRDRLTAVGQRGRQSVLEHYDFNRYYRELKELLLSESKSLIKQNSGSTGLAVPDTIQDLRLAVK